jgi:hypothetical protein
MAVHARYTRAPSAPTSSSFARVTDRDPVVLGDDLFPLLGRQVASDGARVLNPDLGIDLPADRAPARTGPTADVL